MRSTSAAPRASSVAERPRRAARVVHVIDHLGLGGVQTFLRTVLPLLPPELFAPTMIQLRAETELSRSFQAAGVPVISLGQKRWSLCQYVDLARAIQALRPDIVHTHLTVGKLLGRVAALQAGVPAIVLDDQVSVSQDIYSLPPMVVLGYRLLEPHLSPYTDRYISPSRLIQASSQVVKRWPAEKCRVLYNAIDCAQFAPAPDRAACRAALGWPERPTITTFARFIAQKRIGDVLQVARRVSARFPSAQFVIAGRGPLEQQIHEQVRSEGLEAHVLMPGYRQDTAAMLAATDIYLSASAGEAFSVAILEAMASGCAVVATAAGGTVEQITPDVTGLLRRVGDIEGMSAAVAQLLELPDLRRALGAAARQYVTERFDAPVIAAQLAEIYRELLQSKGYT